MTHYKGSENSFEEYNRIHRFCFVEKGCIRQISDKGCRYLQLVKDIFGERLFVIRNFDENGLILTVDKLLDDINPEVSDVIK